MKEDHEDPLEVGDGGLIKSCLIISESVPYTGERGHNQVDNGHTWEVGWWREGEGQREK